MSARHFCPWCGNPMNVQLGFVVPDDDIHGEAVLCSERCRRLWTGAEAFAPEEVARASGESGSETK